MTEAPAAPLYWAALNPPDGDERGFGATGLRYCVFYGGKGAPIITRKFRTKRGAEKAAARYNATPGIKTKASEGGEQ